MQFRVDSSLSVINAFSLPVSEALSLRPGEILKGLVLDLKAPGVLLVQLKGKTMEARTEVPLKVGQELTLLVEEIREGRVFLKVMGGDKAKEWEESRLNNTLTQLGIKPSDEARVALKELLLNRLPVTKENLVWLLQTVETWGKETEVALKAAALMIRGGAQRLPFDLIAALGQFLTVPTPAVQNLEQALLDLARLFQYFSSADEQRNEDLKPFVYPKADIHLEGEPLAETETAVSTGVPGEGKLELLKKLVNLIGILHDDMMVEMEEQEPELPRQLAKTVARQGDYLKALEVLEKLMVREAIDLPWLKNAALLIRQAKDEVLGQAVFNSLDSPEVNPPLDCYYYAFPFASYGGFDKVEVRIWKDKEKRSLAEMDELKVDVFLDTVNLGKMLFHMIWLRPGSLTLQGTVEREDTRTLLMERLNELIASLEKLGFSVQVSKISLGPIKAGLRPKIEAEPEVRLHFWGIDVRV